MRLKIPLFESIITVLETLSDDDFIMIHLCSLYIFPGTSHQASGNDNSPGQNGAKKQKKNGEKQTFLF